jgi:hypothetical protein
MKRAIEIIPSKPGYVPFDVDVKEPGIVRNVVTGFEEPNMVIPASMGKPPVAELKPLAAIAFEIDPDGEEKKRHFVWLPAGKALEFPGTLEWRANYVDETTGTPLFLYEALKGGG